MFGTREQLTQKGDQEDEFNKRKSVKEIRDAVVCIAFIGCNHTLLYRCVLFRDKSAQRRYWQSLSEIRHHYRDEVLALKRGQIDNLKEIKDRLIVLELAMRKLEMEKAKPKEEPKPVAESSLAESAIRLESMSDEEYRAMVLEHVKASDRQLIDQHFKQENAFKVSLKPAEKQKFDADVKRECAKLLASSKVEGELSSLQKKLQSSEARNR